MIETQIDTTLVSGFFWPLWFFGDKRVTLDFETENPHHGLFHVSNGWSVVGLRTTGDVMTGGMVVTSGRGAT